MKKYIMILKTGHILEAKTRRESAHGYTFNDVTVLSASKDVLYSVAELPVKQSDITICWMEG